MPLYEPVILKNVINHWPALKPGLESPKSLAEYIEGFDNGNTINSYSAPSSIEGQFFYEESMRGVNFNRVRETLSTSIESLISYLEHAAPPAQYTGAVSTVEHLPGFSDENSFDLAGKTAVSRIWIGNRVVVPTHYDMLDNIICTISGRRRLTLFPPGQIKNLYIGPVDFTLSGQPISMVDLKNPNFDKFPKFKCALEAALVVDLEPGDCLYIPKLWWHHVESLDKFNVIVNYWWNQSELGQDNPFTTILHGLLTVSHLPKKEKEAWKAFFDHYLFHANGHPADHIPDGAQGILGDMDFDNYKKIRTLVASTFRS